MTRPIVRIHDMATNEIVDREMNDEEFAAYEAQKIVAEEKAAEKEAKETAKAALLARLGMTAEEAALLLS